MDRELEVLHLKKADAPIEKAEKKIISRQRDVIDELLLERNGHDLTTARIQLERFEGILTTMLWHRSIIVKRIADIDRNRSPKLHLLPSEKA